MKRGMDVVIKQRSLLVRTGGADTVGIAILFWLMLVKISDESVPGGKSNQPFIFVNHIH